MRARSTLLREGGSKVLLKRRIAFAALALSGLTMAGCSNSPPSPSPPSTRPSEPSSTPGVDRVACDLATRALGDLKTVGNEASPTFDSTARRTVDTAIRDLKALANEAPTARVASLANDVSSALGGLESLAQSDPDGNRAATRAKAKDFEQRYVTAVQNLEPEIDTACHPR